MRVEVTFARKGGTAKHVVKVPDTKPPGPYVQKKIEKAYPDEKVDILTITKVGD